MFVICVTIGMILYGLSDFLKAIVLCLKLKGPPAVPFLGNVLMLQDKDCKFLVFLHFFLIGIRKLFKE